MYSNYVSNTSRLSILPKEILQYINDIVTIEHCKAHKQKYRRVMKELWREVEYPGEYGTRLHRFSPFQQHCCNWLWRNGQITIDKEVSMLYFVNKDGFREHK